MIQKILAKPGVTPGLFGGLALPLALLVGANLPSNYQTEAFELGLPSYLILFITMPFLGAIVAHFTANKIIRAHFITAVCAPALILGAYLLYNTSVQKQLFEQKNKEFAGEIQNQQQNRIADIQATQPENPALLTGQDVQ